MTNLFIGTSGYKYKDWVGVFYPEGLEEKKNLNYYGQSFNAVEINFTYYSHPNPFIFYNLAKKVRKGFQFSVKAHSSVTHSRDFKKEEIKNFFDSLKPLKDASKLGCILLQFPFSFKFSQSSLEYLKEVGERFQGYESAVEFRNDSWLREETFKTLKDLRLGFCNVDQPQLRGLLPPTDINTTRVGYIRFHGRNSAQWWNHQHAYQRYDYLYSSSELEEWLPRIKNVGASTEKTYIFFNNHYKAKSAKSAKTLIDILKDSNIITSQN